MKEKLKKILKNRCCWFIFFCVIFLMYLWNKDVRYMSGDAYESWEVAKTLFSNNVYASYVMYKGIYAFIIEAISYNLGILLKIPEFLFLKVAKSMMLSYICIFGIPNIIEDIFKYTPKIWQIVFFTVCTFLIERCTFALLSVDLLSSFIFILSINVCNKYLKNDKKYTLPCIGVLFGISSCVSGQYSISTYIILVFLIINIIKKYRKEIVTLLLALMLIFIGFFIAKEINTCFEREVVDELRKDGEWIPTGNIWMIHGLSSNMTMINYPVMIKDNLGLSIVLDDNDNSYNAIAENIDVYNWQSYFKLIAKYPLGFTIRWIERMFLGLIADPLNVFPGVYHFGNLVIAFMSVAIYVFWNYIGENLKNVKQLINKQAIIFYAFLFSALIPTFNHVENRYYISCRMMLIGILLLTPKLNDLVKKIRKKEFKFSNINMKMVSCIAFTLICFTAYYALYQSTGINNMLINL